MRKYLVICFMILFLLVGCVDENKKEYKLILNLNNGSGEQIIEELDEPTSVDLVTPTRDGYDFVGWKCDGNILTESTIYVDKVITLNAVWNGKEYQVTLIDELDGYKNEMKVKYGDMLSLTDRKYPGYKFLGWYKETELVEGGVYDYLEDITLYARYEKNTYSISYYVDGEIYETVDVLYDDYVKHLDVEKKGYRFIGWYLDNVRVSNGKYQYTSDITLTAKFEQETYIINFIDGNKEVQQPIYVKYLENIALPVMSKTGYTFLGWYDGEQKIEDGPYLGTYSMSLYTKWTPNTYYITFMSDGEEVLEPLEVKYNTSFELPSFNKDGSTFLGWYYNENILEDGKYLYLHDITVVANWKDGITKSYIGKIDVTLFNTQTARYDEVSIFDSSTNITASRYWHKYAIVKEKDYYKISGIAGSGEPLSTLGSYDYVILAYTDYAKYSEFVNIGLNIGDIVEFSVDPTHFVKGSINVTVSCYNTLYPDPDKNEFINYLNSLYGNITSLDNDINLVKSYLGHQIIWKTSNKNVITSSGKYTKPAVTRNVTLTAIVNKKEIYNFTVKVKGDKEQSEALATGYFYTRFSDSTEDTFKNLDIAYISFAYVNSNGEFTNMSETSTFLKNLLSNIVPKARKAGTKIVISINQENHEFGTIAGDATLRKTFANNIVKMLNKYEFDGIDIDWETPTTAEAPTFTLLMKEIYETVKANNPSHLVTAAIGGGRWQPPKYDLQNSSQYLDYINLMTYSMVSRNGQFHNALYKSSKGYTLSSCSIEESIEIYDSYNVPRDKILIGLAFYGVKQTGSKGVGTACVSSSSYTYRGIYHDYLENPREGVEICFDEETASPYIYDAINGVFISYENELSIAKKCDYVNSLGLAGVMYWQDGHDYNDVLLDAIKTNIKK